MLKNLIQSFLGIIFVALIACNDPKPSAEVAENYFKSRYPNVIVHEVTISEYDKKEDKMVFSVIYSTEKNQEKRKVEMPYELHSVTGHWVQRPALVEDLDSQ